ncbi:hypothetical protein IFM89_037794 [Coptis chinensis]|uniref:t-SNARE coiled-coil homology domain-containing protein n=1 Tax=Coptis chinensis TaxID=261450 RepID=A0A835LGZ4_9MAGN|nr:hypothetical protein IFM89_037794 [Coptis chinensis]
MEVISTLLLDLQELNEETKSTHSAKVLRGLKDRMDSNMVTVLRKGKIIKALRNRIVTKHKGLKRRYYNATGKVATDEEIDKLEAIKEIQRSLTEVTQVFLDMAKSLVDAQGEQMDDIELNVANARVYIAGGTNRLISTLML